jgi:hypothetical protein
MTYIWFNINYVTRDLHSYGILHSVDWWILADVSGEPIDLKVKGHAAEEEFSFECMTAENGNDRSYRNVRNCQARLHKIPYT